jgi:hypothetical protein
VVVAETEPLARRAAKAVSVQYEDLPAIISIEDAIEAGSYYEQYHGDSLISGDLEAGFAGRPSGRAGCGCGGGKGSRGERTTATRWCLATWTRALQVEGWGPGLVVWLPGTERGQR